MTQEASTGGLAQETEAEPARSAGLSSDAGILAAIAELAESVAALKTSQDERFTDLKESQTTVTKELKELTETVEDLRESQTIVTKELKELTETVEKIRQQVVELDARSERQERRLAAIESFPGVPQVKQSPRLYATDEHSVSLQRRIRVGRTG